jgi:transcriptional regulator with XRE-family HTH domain
LAIALQRSDLMPDDARTIARKRDIGRQITAQRLAKGQGQKWLAAQAGYADAAPISRIESGHAEPGLSKLIAIADALEFDLLAPKAHRDVQELYEGLDEGRLALLRDLSVLLRRADEVALQVLREQVRVITNDLTMRRQQRGEGLSPEASTPPAG